MPQYLTGRRLSWLQAYLSVLSICSIGAKQEWRDIASRHLAILLFVDFGVYFFLDAWPYATIHGRPYDDPSAAMTWSGFLLLFVSGVLIPLVMPRPYRPLQLGVRTFTTCSWTKDLIYTQHAPVLKDVVSILSRATFSYLDKIIFYAWRVPDISIKDLPEQLYDLGADTLSKRNFKVSPLLTFLRLSILTQSAAFGSSVSEEEASCILGNVIRFRYGR